jgi:hypothetical protein
MKTPILIFLAAFAFAAPGEVQARATRWSDIHTWERVGYRWLLAKDTEGQPLALYDLSYPEINQSIPIGRVGQNANGAEVQEALALLAQEEGASAQQVETLQSELNKANQGSRVVLEDGWHTRVPWRQNSRVAQAKNRDQEPEAFRFSEIAFEQWVHFSKRKKTFESLEKVEQLADRLYRGLDDEERPSYHFETLPEALEKGLLDWVEFRRTPSKGEPEYEIWWVSPHQDSALGGSLTRPAKLVDFWSQKEGLVIVLLMEAMRFAGNQLVGQIPVPALSNLFALAMGRILRFSNEIRTVRQSMLLEMIDHAQDVADGLTHDPETPFLKWTDEQRFWAMSYIYYARSSWTSALEWIFKTPGQYWAKDRQEALNRAEAIKQNYQQKAQSLEALGLRYAFDPEAQQLLLSAREPHRDGTAYVGVDLMRPRRIYIQRSLLLASSIVSEYALSFIPWIGGLLHSLYGQFIDRPLRISGVWEARMEAYLEHRSDAERWKNALQILSYQRVNPMELSRAGQEQLIRRRLEALGVGASVAGGISR